ncbi:MAG: zinc-ribbon domain-containing protein [Promethearchaeota archaeon]
MFCPVCGKELEQNARFCPECGAKIVGGAPTPYVKTKYITSPAPATISSKHPTHSSHSPRPARHYRRRRRGLTVGLFIGILLLAGGGIFGIVMAVNWGSIEGYNYYYYDNPTPASIESFQFDIDTSDADIRFNETQTDHLIAIEYHYRISGGFMDEKTFEDIFTVTWDNLSAVVSFTSEFQWFTNWVFNDRSVITIILRSDVIWAIDGGLSTGQLDLIAPEDTMFNNFTLEATTGDIDLTILNGTVFQEDFNVAVSTGSISISGNEVEFQKSFSVIGTTGDIDVYGTDYKFQGDIYADISTGSVDFFVVTPEIGESVELYSTTGDIDIGLTNPTYSSTVSNWVLDASTGSIELSVIQTDPIATNITGNVHATTGNIYISMTLDASIGARFDSSVVTGGYNYYNQGGFDQLGSVFQTTTYPRSSNYDFTLGVSTGRITVDGLIQ